jgi:hypothetical protein
MGLATGSLPKTTVHADFWQRRVLICTGDSRIQLFPRVQPPRDMRCNPLEHKIYKNTSMATTRTEERISLPFLFN